jgi:hypothetical protein
LSEEPVELSIEERMFAFRYLARNDVDVVWRVTSQGIILSSVNVVDEQLGSDDIEDGEKRLYS